MSFCFKCSTGRPNIRYITALICSEINDIAGVATDISLNLVCFVSFGTGKSSGLLHKVIA